MTCMMDVLATPSLANGGVMPENPPGGAEAAGAWRRRRSVGARRRPP